MREDTNLYYYGARWYAPSLGRFLQANTILPIEQGTQGWERYAYVNNNPLAFIDSDGNFAWLPVITIAGAVVGAAIDYSQQVKQNYENNGGNLAAALTEDIDVGSIASSAAGGAITAFGLAAAAPAVLSMAGTGLMGLGVTTGSVSLFSAGLTTSGVASGLAAALYGVSTTNPISSSSNPTSITKNYQRGMEGQAASGWQQNQTHLYDDSFTREYRVPDYLNMQEEIIGEIKNVTYQSYTAQLRDYYNWSLKNHHTFMLMLPPNATVSNLLQRMFDSGSIQRIDLILPK